MRVFKLLSAWVLGAGFVFVHALAGCASAPRDMLVAPRTLTAPYDSSRGDVVWAVTPLRNESGVSEARGEVLGDKLVAAAEEVQGVRCVPLNRTLMAMRALEMDAVRSPGDARKLAELLGVDGILVGSITAWDPYTPVLGLSVALYARPGAALGHRAALGARDASTMTADAGGPGSFGDGPLAIVSEHLDAKNNAVLMDIRSYGEGRQSGASALGWKRYTESMDLFGEFAAYRIVDGILQREWVRAGRLPAGTPAGAVGGTAESANAREVMEKRTLRASEGTETGSADR
jgi:hypothetical protein